MYTSLNCDAVSSRVHVENRDELRARIEVLTAEAEANVNNARFRLELEQSQHATEQQRWQFELEEAQHMTTQITIERDELLARIGRLTNVKVN